VLKAGWHCGGDPAANGTVADCPDCKICQNNNCVANPSDNGNTSASGSGCCKDGNVIPKQAPDFDSLIANCPNRTQIANGTGPNARLHPIDGCSLPAILAVLTPGLSVQDPVGGILGLSSTRFGQNQGDVPNAGAALPLPCNQHDICYQTCKSVQATCDTGMFNGMTAVCNAAYPTASCPYSGLEAFAKCIIGDPLTLRNYFGERADCATFSSLYKFGLDKFGSSAWKERQTQFCTCCP
jgi:hypothetical protein